MKSLVLGYIRPELQYTSRGAVVFFTCSTCTDVSTEALIDDIEFDKKVALKSLARPGYEKYMSDPFFQVQ
jgi:riboflavin kinase